MSGKQTYYEISSSKNGLNTSDPKWAQVAGVREPSCTKFC